MESIQRNELFNATVNDAIQWNSILTPLGWAARVGYECYNKIQAVHKISDKISQFCHDKRKLFFLGKIKANNYETKWA